MASRTDRERWETAVFRIGVPETVDQPINQEVYEFQVACVWECLLQRYGGVPYLCTRLELYENESEPVEEVAEEFGLLYIEVRDGAILRKAGHMVERAKKESPELRTILDRFDLDLIETEWNLGADYDEYDYEDSKLAPKRYDCPLWRIHGHTDEDLGLVRYCLRFRSLQSRAGLSAAEASAYLHEAWPESLGDVARRFGLTEQKVEEAYERAVRVVGGPDKEAQEVPMIRRATPGPGEPYTLVPMDTPYRTREAPRGDRDRLEAAILKTEISDKEAVRGEYVPFRLPTSVWQGLGDLHRYFISDYFSDAPDDVLSTLVYFTKYDVIGESTHMLLPGAVTDYAGTRWFRLSKRDLFLARNPSLSKSGKGAHRNLSDVVDRLSDRALAYEDDSVLVTWTSDWSLPVYFKRCALMGVVPVPDVLDSDSAPDYVLDYVVFVGETRCSNLAMGGRIAIDEGLSRFPAEKASEATRWLRRHGVSSMRRRNATILEFRTTAVAPLSSTITE